MYRCSGNSYWVAEQVGDPPGGGMGGSSNTGHHLQGHTSTPAPPTPTSGYPRFIATCLLSQVSFMDSLTLMMMASWSFKMSGVTHQ